MSEIERMKIDVYDLQIGLFVCALDRPWAQTSFPLQGFQVRSNRELTALKSVCQYVYIDTTKSRFESDAARKRFSTGQTSRTQSQSDKYRASTKPLELNRQRYQLKNSIPSSQDFASSAANFGRVSDSVQKIYDNIRSDKDLDGGLLGRASDSLTNSVIDMPTASFWSALLQQHEDKIYIHDLRTATWALICGRHIGFDSLQLTRLAQGILLKDVYRLSGQFDVKEKSDPVLTSVSVLQDAGLHPKVIAVVKYHREKFNGSGRPFSLVGEKIPILARIASIATAYDLALHPIKDHSKAKSPSSAAKLLYNQKGKAFQEELVVEFIEAIGLYPLGTMVELSTGDQAVVVKHNPQRRLKPEVMVIRNNEGEEVNTLESIDLAVVTNVHIVKDLPGSADKVDLKNIFENSVLAMVDKNLREKASSGGGFMKKLFGG